MSNRPAKYRATVRKDFGRNNRMPKTHIARIERILSGEFTEMPVTKTNYQTAVRRSDGQILSPELAEMVANPEKYPNLRTLRPGLKPDDGVWTIVWDSDEPPVSHPTVIEVPVNETNKRHVKNHIPNIKTEDVTRMLNLPAYYPNLRTRRVGPEHSATWTLIWDGCKEE